MGLTRVQKLEKAVEASNRLLCFVESYGARSVYAKDGHCIYSYEDIEEFIDDARLAINSVDAEPDGV